MNCLSCSCLFILVSWGHMCPFSGAEASGPTMGKVSESLTLTHHISGIRISDSSCAWDWICQTPVSQTVHIASSFHTQVTSSADPSRNQLSLGVLSPAAADTVTYFCSTKERIILEGPG
uniref:Immunoglobulin V-set domain-containing protein n=1 Tax=Athene cunicularia TaxID=194338 RepID=A0A663MYL9_ATHCN